MANKTFSSLSPAAALTGAEIVPLTQLGASVRTTLAAIKSYMGVGGKASFAIGDGSSASFTLTHGLGTRDVCVTVYRNATPWDTVIADVSRPTENSVVVTGFIVAPSSGQFQVVIRS